MTFARVMQRLAPLGAPLAGRASEMDVLRRAWADAGKGRGGTVLLSGEAGVGKTRLAAELAGEVDAAGAVVLVGGCPAGGAEPYHPLIEALGALPAGDGDADREALFDAMAAAVVAQARRAPVLLVLDDLHRAGRSTLLAVRRVVEAAAGAPLLVVGTYRDTALDRSHPMSEFLSAVLARPRVERVSVGGLSPADLVEMVGDAELARRLWRQSEGNPVRAVELLRLGDLDLAAPPAFDDLVARRVEGLSPAACRFLEAAAVAGSDFRVDVVGAAAGVAGARAPAALKELAAAGLVIEETAGPGDVRRFAHDMVREAIDRRLGPAARVRLHLRIARALDGGYQGPSGPRSGEHGPSGPQSGYQGPSGPRSGYQGPSGPRSGYQGPSGPRSGEPGPSGPRSGYQGPSGEQGPRMPAALLAWHFRAAAPVGGSAVALRHSARAGERAMEVLAWEEAAVQYGHALAAATGAGLAVRADLLLSLGEAQRLAGEPARARQAFLEAATLARCGQDGPRLARAALALGQVAAVWGADPELEVLAAEASALLGRATSATLALSDLRSGDRPMGLRPVTDFSSDALYDFLDGADGPSRPTAAAVRPKAGHDVAVALLRARHVALAGPEHAAERLLVGQDLVGLAAETGDDEMAVNGRAWRLVAAMELGRLDQATTDQVAHAEVARRLGQPRHTADAAAWTAMRALLDGRTDDARAAAADAFATAADAEDPEAEESFLVQRWWLALEWGTPEDLSEVADGCRARALAQGGRTWRAAAALALARSGRLDLAAEELRRVTDHGLGELIRDPGRLHPLTCLAEVAWALGDSHRASMVGPLLEPFADHLVVVGRGLACRGSVARACGLVAASAQQWDAAEQHFQSALAVHRRIGALPLLARTHLQWSRTLSQRGRKGDKRRAADAQRKSAELATRLGMSSLLEEIAVPARSPTSDRRVS